MIKHTKHRIIAIVLTIFLIIPCAIVSRAAELPDYIPEKYFKLADDIAEAARNFESSVDLSKDGITVNTLETIMAIVLNENPDLFHLNNGYRYSHTISDPFTVLEVLLYYKMDKADYNAAIESVNTWVTSVVSLADPDFTEMEYAIFFHDYLCANYQYDTEFLIRNVYSFITEGKGVCQAYTYVYMLLLDAVGIENSFASSTEMNHIWNLVKLDGEWYHADLTWDDPVGGVPGVSKHKFFLLSDKAISTNEGSHYGWVSLHSCTSEKYDGSFLNQSSSSYAYVDGYWYFTKDGDLWRTDSPDTEGSLFKEMDMCWNVWDSQAYYTGTYSGLIAIDGKLYMNTSNTLIMIDPSTGNTQELYRHNGNDGYIYGFISDMGEDGTAGAGTGIAILNVSQKPNTPGYNIRVNLDGSGIHATPGSGDANSDGKVNLSDASLMLKHIALWDVDLNNDAADTDRNGTVNLTDASTVLKIIAGWSVGTDRQTSANFS